jgi:Caspase domain
MPSAIDAFGCLIAILLVAWAAGSLATSAAAETRVALVIGIDAYQNAPPLTNPVNDAQAIGDALRRLNFDVDEIHDPDFRALGRSLRDFGIRAQGADVALVYYAGHGVQVDQENYLIPADAKIERTRDLAYEAFPLSLMLDEVSRASKIGIILLDSCRNNPFIERVSRSLSVAGRAVATTTPGLARIDNVPRNTIVVMAAKANAIAEDGEGHSPFAAAILANLQIPGLELGLFFRSVRDVVLKATQNRQEPYVFSSLGAEPFYFYPLPPNRPPVIGPISTLQVADTAGPTPLGIPTPTDPDQDPLSVRVIGLPRSGEVLVQGRKPMLGEAFSVDKFMTGTFKPDGTMFGQIGTLDILVEDGRGGSVVGSLPIVVLRSNQPQTATPPPWAPQASPAPVASAEASARPSSSTALSLVAPPPSVPPPTPSPPFSAIPAPAPQAKSGLEEARASALGVPCALLDIEETAPPGQPPHLKISGWALQGLSFLSFLQQLETPGRNVGVATKPLDPGHCAAVAVVSDLVRRTRARRALRLVTPSTPVAAGIPMMIAVETIPNGTLYVDLLSPDGLVQHLRRGHIAASTSGSETPIALAAPGQAGQWFLVAITTATSLDLEQRPSTESEGAYLPALRGELARLAAAEIEARAEVATLSVIAAPRPVAVSSRSPASAPVAPRTANSTNPRCQEIVSHVALGDTLSDADRMILRTGCGR